MGQFGHMNPDSYRVSAKYYEGAYAAKPELVDVPFYLELAKQTGGPILEIACGTGRVLLSLARAGIGVYGVDNSVHMLQVLRENLSQEPREVQEQVSIETGDMRNFRLKKEFPLVIIPFRPMQHMYTVGDQVSALKTAAFHLQESGRLVFDVFFPKFEHIPERIGQEIFELEWPHPSDPTKVMRRYFRKESYDKINQNFRATFIFRTYQGEKLVQQESERLQMSYYTYPHLRALFLLAGLEPVEEYGSFNKTPLDNTAEDMIFVLKKSA
jgi:SAM-dependent methyltransferase